MRSHFAHEIPFIQHRRQLLGLSVVLVALAVVGLVARGLVFGIEFQGGTEIDFTNTGSVTIAQMRDALSDAGEKDASVQTTVSDAKSGFLVRTGTTDPSTANRHAATAAKALGLTSRTTPSRPSARTGARTSRAPPRSRSASPSRSSSRSSPFATSSRCPSRPSSRSCTTS